MAPQGTTTGSEATRTLRQRRGRTAPIKIEIRKVGAARRLNARQQNSPDSPDSPGSPGSAPAQGQGNRAGAGAGANAGANAGVGAGAGAGRQAGAVDAGNANNRAGVVAEAAETGLPSPDSPDTPAIPGQPPSPDSPDTPTATIAQPPAVTGGAAPAITAAPPSPASPASPDTPNIPGQTTSIDSPSPTQSTFQPPPQTVAPPPPQQTVAPPPPPRTTTSAPPPPPATTAPPPPPPTTTSQQRAEQTTSSEAPPPPQTTQSIVIAQPVLAAPLPSPDSPDTPTFTTTDGFPLSTTAPILPGITPSTNRKAPVDSASPEPTTLISSTTIRELINPTDRVVNPQQDNMNATPSRLPHIASVEDILGVTLGAIAVVAIIIVGGMFLYYYRRKQQPGGQNRPSPFDRCLGRRRDDNYSDTSSQQGAYRTDSKIMGDLMGAAWAAENGNSGYDNGNGNGNGNYGYGNNGTPPVKIIPEEKRAWVQFPGQRARARESTQSTSTVGRWLRELTPFLGSKRNTVAQPSTARASSAAMPAMAVPAAAAAPPLPGMQSRWSDSTRKTPPSPSATSRAGDPNRVSALTEDGVGPRRGPKTESSLYSLYASRTEQDRTSWALAPPPFRPGTMRTVDSEELEKWGIPGVGRDADEDLPPVPVTPASVLGRR